MTNWTTLPYENLRAYQAARELLVVVHEAKIADPKLRDQALRAAKSVCLNIAEAVGRYTAADQKRVFAIARGEVCEVNSALDIAARLQTQGARIKAYDPVAMKKAQGVLKNVTFCKDAYEAAQGADCLALITEWPQFRSLDFARVKRLMSHPIVVDGRNFLDGVRLKALGFEYLGMGRFAK